MRYTFMQNLRLMRTQLCAKLDSRFFMVIHLNDTFCMMMTLMIMMIMMMLMMIMLIKIQNGQN